MIHSSAFSNLVSRAIPALVCLTCVAAPAQQITSSTQHRDSEHVVTQTVAGATALKARVTGARTGISLAVADFDRDGTQDLATGYTLKTGGVVLLQRGSPAAMAPQPADLETLNSGGVVEPFLAKAVATEVPVRPDFLKAVDLNGNGTIDLVVAAKGDSALYYLQGDGVGNFAAPKILALSGILSALATWRGPTGDLLLVAAVHNAAGSSLQMLGADGTTLATIKTPSVVTAIEIAPVNARGLQDLVILTASKSFLIDGQSIANGSPQRETLPVSGAVAVAYGNFIYDRRGLGQLALLDGNGTLHILARSGIVNTVPTTAEVRANRGVQHTTGTSPAGLPWSEVETLTSIAPSTSNDTAPIMIRGRLTANYGDDLAIMANKQYVLVAHPVETANGLRQSTAVVTMDSTSNTVMAATASRISADGRLGLIVANATLQPSVSLPPTNKTLTVTTATDGIHSGTTCTSGATCSLRDAIGIANNDAAANGRTKVDTINLPAGIFSFTTSYHPPNDSFGDLGYAYDIDASVNIVGVGASSTIITGNGLDKIFSIDFQGVTGAYAADTVFMSNLTLENGKNTNQPASGADNYGGLLDFESNGPGSLTINNCTLTGGVAFWGPGGAIAATNQLGESDSGNVTGNVGPVELDNSIVSNNSSPEQGGGLWITPGNPLILNNTTISGNKVALSINAADVGGSGPDQGGGIYLSGLAASASTITNSTITGNSSAGAPSLPQLYGGGGLFSTGGGFTMTNTVVTNNQSGTNGAGIWISNDTKAAITINDSTITGNSLVSAPANSDGAGIYVLTGSDSGTQLAMHYSRIHSNTGGAHNGLAYYVQTGSNDSATLNVTDNWWGCNGPGTGTGCDLAGIDDIGTGGTLTASPFTKLVISPLAPATTAGSTLTFTGGLGQDSAGTTYTVANDIGYSTVPATLTITQGSSTTSSTATTLNTSAAISTSATATASGTATVTVDGATASTTFTVTSPDLVVHSSHAGNFKAGDTADVYALSVSNIGAAPTSGVVTLTDTLPAGFTATSLSGTGWSCTPATLTCTRSDALAAGGTYPPVTLTFFISIADAGTYVNQAFVANPGDGNTSNNFYNDPTAVIGVPTIAQAFSPSRVGQNSNSILTFTLGNPSANPQSLTGVNFIDALPTNLNISTPNALATTCLPANITAPSGGSSITLTGATIAPGATCTVSVHVSSAIVGSYTSPAVLISSNDSNAGTGASATLTVIASSTTILSVTPASPVNAGTVVTLSAAVSSPGAVTVGTVFFYDTSTTPATPLGSASLSAGVATIKLVPATGTHTIIARYQGANPLPAQTSPSMTLVVTPVGTYRTVQSITAVSTGTGLNLTDVATFYGQSVPTGSIQFTDGATNTVLGTVAPTPLTQTLAAPTSFSSGAAANGALISVTGDFNKDGFQDIAVANFREGTIGILLGNGDGTFKPKVIYPAGAEPYQMAMGDFNHDQNPDLVVVNMFSNTVSVLLGKGDGTFAAPIAYPTGTEPYSVTVTDLNNDGLQDLVVTNLGDKTLGVLLGKGDGTFAAQTITAVGNDADYTVAADFNGDGMMDIIVLNGGDKTAGLLLGKNDGTFQSQITFATGSTPYSATVADFNNDGLPDVAIANLGDNTVSILLNAGSGTFKPQVTYATGTEPTSVIALGLDGTSQPGLAVTNYTGNTISLLLGNSNGTFQPQVAFPTASAPYQLSFADFNGDGKQDLSVTTYTGNTVNIQLGTQTATVSLNNVFLVGPKGFHNPTATYIVGSSDAYKTSVSGTTVQN